MTRKRRKKSKGQSINELSGGVWRNDPERFKTLIEPKWTGGGEGGRPYLGTLNSFLGGYLCDGNISERGGEGEGSGRLGVGKS